jgi:hypothetical protein
MKHEIKKVATNTNTLELASPIMTMGNIVVSEAESNMMN